MQLLINLFLSTILSGTITGKLHVEELCFTQAGKTETDCRLDSYYFELEDFKTKQRGLQRVTELIYNRQKVNDAFFCNSTVCLDMAKGVK